MRFRLTAAAASRPAAGPVPRLVEACADKSTSAARDRERRTGSISACLMQAAERLPATRLGALGTEPFWAARIEGRCITYTHPEDRAGTRIWTRYNSGADGDSWSGALSGHPFELRTRTQPDCSNGMSDKRYPLAVELRVTENEGPAALNKWTRQPQAGTE